VVLVSQPRREKGAGASVDLPLGVADGHLNCQVSNKDPRESCYGGRPGVIERTNDILLCCIPQIICNEENQSEARNVNSNAGRSNCMFNCCVGRRRDAKGLKEDSKVFALFPKELRWYWAKITSVTGKGTKRTFSVRAFI
jgi:hypothetical protein